MAQYRVFFTPLDGHSTEPGELSYAIHTGPGSSGTLLTSGTATSGIEVMTGLIDDGDLSNGSNTRYLTLTDGAGNTLETPFNVEALLDRDVEFDPDLLALQVTDSAQVSLDGPEDVAVFSIAEGATILITLDIVSEPDPAGVALGEDGSVLAEVPAADPATLTLEDYAILAASAAVSDPGGMALAEAGAIENQGSPDPAALSAGENASLGIVPPADEESLGFGESVALDADMERSDPSGFALAEAGTLEADILVTASLAMTLAESAFVEVSGIEFRGSRVRAEIYLPDGSPAAAGPLWAVLHAEYELRAGAIGSFTLELPASDAQELNVVSGSTLKLYAEGEGLVFRGIVESAEITFEDNRFVQLISGSSRARELVYANTFLGYAFEDEPLEDAVNALLSGTGWTIGTLADPGAKHVTARFEGLSTWQALTELADLYGWTVREDNLNRQIDIGPHGTVRELTFRNVEGYDPDDLPEEVWPLESLTITDEEEELWNLIVPVGSGEGLNRLTLEHSDRTAPYAIQTMAGPNGETLYYLADEASILRHGPRRKTVTFDEIAPMSDAEFSVKQAANLLYDYASTWLMRHAKQSRRYALQVPGLKHLVDGEPIALPGDRVRLAFRGMAYDPDGQRYLWREVDELLYIESLQRRFNPEGASTWQIEVSTERQRSRSDVETLADYFEDLWKVQTSLKPYTYREIHNMGRESIEPGREVSFRVSYENDVTMLHRAILSTRFLPVRSNAMTAAAGGGQTTVASGDHTHGVSGQSAQSGGGQTSGPSGAHSHSVSGQSAQTGGPTNVSSTDSHTHIIPPQTIFSSGDHWHKWADAQPTVGWNDPAYLQQIVTEQSNGASFGFYTGRNGSDPWTTGLYTITNGSHIHNITQETSGPEFSHGHGINQHTHSVSTGSTGTLPNHQHTVSDHTHTVSFTTTSEGGDHTHSIPDHTHGLTYGIYEGPNPNAPYVRVYIDDEDITADLGGPWNGGFDVDITPWLIDADGQIIRATRTIKFTASQLFDLQAEVRSLVTAYAVMPVS